MAIRIRRPTFLACRWWPDGVLDLSDERLAARSGTLNLMNSDLNNLDLNLHPVISFHFPPGVQSWTPILWFPKGILRLSKSMFKGFPRALLAAEMRHK